jgi:hypothetical protein
LGARLRGAVLDAFEDDSCISSCPLAHSGVEGGSAAIAHLGPLQQLVAEMRHTFMGNETTLLDHQGTPRARQLRRALRVCLFHRTNNLHRVQGLLGMGNQILEIHP